MPRKGRAMWSSSLTRAPSPSESPATSWHRPSISPEHAHVICEDWEAVMNNLREVGMVGLGDFSPIALSDYAAGPSHVLPTDGTAAWASPRSVNDFITHTNYMHFTQEALEDLAPHVERLARLEGLENHAES